jgi:hypothetical protein
MKRTLSLGIALLSLTVVYVSAVVLAYLKWPEVVAGIAIAAGVLVIVAAAGVGVYLWRLTRPKPRKITGDYRLVIRQPQREIMRNDYGQAHPYRDN